MNEAELLGYLQAHFPRETPGCEWKEFKNLRHSVSGDKGADVISYVSAIANMEGGALVMGVEDGLARIVGIQDFHSYDPSNFCRRILGRCTDLDSEGLCLESFTASDTGKIVWVLRIPRHFPRRPVYAHDQAWQRLEDSIGPMRPERRDTILAEDLGLIDWSAEVVAKARLMDLDPDAIRMAREKFKERNQRASFFQDIDGWSDAEFLDRARLTIGRGITHAALILLGRAESIHFLPASAQITWKLVGEELAYRHFGPPFISSTTDVLACIRNIPVKHFATNQLLATEVSKYDIRVILEALHNCIAHQDYAKGARIILTERVDRLTFENAGTFFDGRPEDYLEGGRTPKCYRNPWLSKAMVNLAMIDTVGYGIHTITMAQAKRFFPLPDYSRSTANEVVLDIYGHSVDENYTRLLLENRDLPLGTVILLDRVQKRQPITDDAAALLRRQGLLEGRKPNFFVAAQVAKVTDRRAQYIRNRAFDDEHYKQLVISFLEKYKSASRKEIEDLLLDKLSDALDEAQKKNKVHNLISALSRARVITKVNGKVKGVWVLTQDG